MFQQINPYFQQNSLKSIPLVTILCLMLAPYAAWALPSWNPPGGDDGTQQCNPEYKVSGQPVVAGFTLVGQTVTVDGAHVKLINTNQYCKDSFHALGSGDFQWVFELPPGSAATITDTTTLQPRITLDVGGSYTARLTACPNGCTVTTGSPDGPDLVFEVPEQPQKVAAFETVTTLPPETRPVLPASATNGTPATPASRAERDERCLFGGGVLDPQWVTIHEFNGPSDYAGGGIIPGEVKAVEGFVFKSKVSRKDSPLNHDSQDHNFHLKPDPAHRWVLLSGVGLQDLLGIEWETAHFDQNYAPSNGDRASVFGYWIHDCGHQPFASEIHPPVGLAVHRPRAIRIPDDATFPELGGSTAGTNIYMPGILTEVFFNPLAGEMMKCRRTSLKEPGMVVVEGNMLRKIPGDCIRQPSPLAGFVYSFNIYLPRNAKAALEPAGVSGLPPIPLYYRMISDGPSTPPVTITPTTEGGITSLHVEVDLRGYADPVAPQSFKIVAAWVYPTLDNWGLRRWRVALNSIDVHDDSDSSVRGKGEWNMWFHVNNAGPETRRGESRHEWAKVIDQDISDHTFVVGPSGQLIQVGPPLLHDFGGRPWSTGAEIAADRSLGPDLMLYPGQAIQVHSSGYESDTTTQDSLALVDDLRLPQNAMVASRNICKASNDLDSLIYSGCADYVLNYEITSQGAAPGADLSPAAEALMASYTFGEDGGCPPGDDVCPPVVVIGDLPPLVPEQPWHPDYTVVSVDDPIAPIHDSSLFKPQGVEEFGLVEIDIGLFHDLIAERYGSDPDAVADELTRLREVVDQLHDEIGPEVLLDAQIICASLPTMLCRDYFGELGLPEPGADASTGRMTGSAKLGRGRTRTTVNVVLHCAPLLRPNKFDLSWGDGRQFALDVMTAASCGDGATPVRHHTGWALGRLDGKPGAMVQWTLEDNGEPGRADTAHIIVYDAARNVILDQSGTLDAGNLNAHEH